MVQNPYVSYVETASPKPYKHLHFLKISVIFLKMLNVSKHHILCWPYKSFVSDWLFEKDKMVHICFNIGLVKFGTPLKVFGSLKLASSFAIRDAILIAFGSPPPPPQGAEDYGYAEVENAWNDITIFCYTWFNKWFCWSCFETVPDSYDL